MSKVVVCLSILLLARFCSAADDTRLDKPVTLAVKGEALVDILPMIEKQTGARLKIAHEIEDQKAAIFVDDKPLKEIMAGLTTVFGFTWSYSDFGGERSYSLSMPIKLRRQRENWRKQAIEKAWPEFEKEIKRLAEMPVKTREELDEMLRRAEATESFDDKTALYGKLGEYGLDRRKRMAARLYQTFSPNLRKMLREGMTICYDLDSPEPEWRVPSIVEDEFRQNLVVFYGVGLPAVGRNKWEQRREFETSSIEFTLLASPDKFSAEARGRLGKCEYDRGLALYSSYSVPIFEKPLARINPEPVHSLPRKDDPVLDSRVSYTTKEIEEEAALPKPQDRWLEGSYINRSDMLVLLHKKLGLQIISDHYSQWYPWQPAEKVSVRSLLKGFESQEQYPSAGWGWDGKLLYMRAANPPKMDSREIPNSKLRRWQAASKAGTFGLAETAEVHLLTEDQLDMLRTNLRRLGIELGEHDFDVVNPALRLYGLLSLSQQKLAFDGLLSTQAFNAEQRSALQALLPRTMAHEHCRVGIYDSMGVRIDKPADMYPESVRIVAKDPIEFYAIGNRPVAKTLEETLKEVKTEWDRSALRQVVETDYEMAITFADGAETRKAFDSRTYRPVKPPSEP